MVFRGDKLCIKLERYLTETGDGNLPNKPPADASCTRFLQVTVPRAAVLSCRRATRRFLHRDLADPAHFPPSRHGATGDN